MLPADEPYSTRPGAQANQMCTASYLPRKSCSETNTKAALRYSSTTIFVKYEEAEIHRSAIMQNFRDSEKKN